MSWETFHEFGHARAVQIGQVSTPNKGKENVGIQNKQNKFEKK